jgi:hypothetical protein
MYKKKRHLCHICGAKKFSKFMYLRTDPDSGRLNYWYCVNKKKCKNYLANYRK